MGGGSEREGGDGSVGKEGCLKFSSWGKDGGREVGKDVGERWGKEVWVNNVIGMICINPV